ncbi:MAG: alanine--tRNA ligase [Chloroflexota bacterium]
MPERTVGEVGAIPFMPANEIRQRFIDFFAERGHTVVPSASLVPAGDQTLLFTNSGMVQFKETLTGAEKRSYQRAVDCQRCLRVAGKHNDFEEVGRTTRHHTFFEMLGNWSFGDYFKKEAIAWAIELLTTVYKIPFERLGATTYKDDEDARHYWREMGMPEERMAIWGDVDKGDDHNFWRMADTGPCGPCSEIHFDRGPHLSEGPHCVPDHDENCPRWLEIWNLVFMEFDQQPDGPRVPLPFKSVDTGMGFERLASVLQGVNTNYDTDIFTPIHAKMRSLLGHDPEKFEKERFSYQVIADHIRALTFLVADGIRPSNEGRGYVFRRILRRAVRHGRLLGRQEPFLADLSGVVVDAMQVAYPFLTERREEIHGVVAAEERQFQRTLDAGVVHFEEALIPITGAERMVGGVRPEQLPPDSPVLPGDVAFRLHDTYGFPIDLTVELAAEYGVRVDRAGFEAALNEQRQRSRGGKKTELADHAVTQALYGQVADRVGASKFLGYDTTSAPAKVVAILRDGTDYQELEAKPEVELRLPTQAEAQIVLDQTPFYAEGGGQVGDQGALKSESGEVVFSVTDTQRPVAGLIVHHGLLHGRVAVGETLTAEVDATRRARTMRNHTATHLLHRALRNTVGERARQAGSLVTPDYLRFDFPLERPLSEDEKRAIETEVRGVVRDNRSVTPKLMSMTDAQAAGADAFFDEKYGEQVRVMFVDGYSRELCGGTHCSATGQIGAFVITGDRSIGSGMRRIEAVTGDAADSYFSERLALLDAAASAAGAKTLEQLPARIDELKAKGARGHATVETVAEPPAKLVQSAGSVDGARFLSYAAPFESMKDLQSYAKSLRAELGTGVIALGLEADEPQLFVTVSDDLVTRGVNAGALVGHGAPLIDGRGGGRAEMAQARGTRRDRLPSALMAIREALEVTLRDGGNREK